MKKKFIIKTKNSSKTRRLSRDSLKVLGIETSCDETAAAVVETGTHSTVRVLSNIVSSQVALHAEFGGVVPNLAAREHLKNILPIIDQSLKEAQVSIDAIDLISVTNRPGLIPALLMGTSTAQTLAYRYKKPLLGVHHIEGHIYANFLTTNTQNQPRTFNTVRFPIIALVVSGGHTQLVLMKDHFTYEIIGQTQDDAVGEAFDKAARILGLGYPGGPEISQKAFEHLATPTPDQVNIPPLPRPMINSPNCDMSFSGLKTAILYAVKNYRALNNIKENDTLPKHRVNALSYEFQEAATDVLIKKTLRALYKTGAKTVILAGGVSANTQLREKLSRALSAHSAQSTKNTPNTQDAKDENIDLLLPPQGLSIDNAAMIAGVAALKWLYKNHKREVEQTNANQTWKHLETHANAPLA